MELRTVTDAERLADLERRIAEARRMIEETVPHRFHDCCRHCEILRVLGGGK